MPNKRVGIFAGLGLTVAAVAATVGVAPSGALEPAANEMEKLKACEQKLCEMVVKKAESGDDLKCDIGKTWAKAKIVEGGKGGKWSWAFDDARCGVEVSAKRATVVSAVTKPEHALEFTEHTIKCDLESGKDVTQVTIKMAPKITFKEGKADKAWLNVKLIEAPAHIKALIWTAAQLEDNLGIFHGTMISEINEFLHQKCPKAMGVPAAAAPKKEKKQK
ncbi:MAG: hypothetical protein ACREC6_04690 [Hyphomicrobiaceae bacterium]